MATQRAERWPQQGLRPAGGELVLHRLTDKDAARKGTKMKTIRVVAPCLIAAGALLACGASSALGAGTPAWFACAKALPKNTGNYTDKYCSEPSAPGEGKWELQEGIGKGKGFKGKGGPAILHVKTWLGDNKVECAKSKSTGKYEAPNREREVTVSFSKCVALFTKSCTTPGAKKGEIKVTGLQGELGYLEEEPTSVGLKLESEANPGPTGELATFECENLSTTLLGGVIGVMSKDIDTISKESETTYVATEAIGEHEFEGFKYIPLVNPLGWASEQEEIEEDLKGEIGKISRPIIKSVICGEFIEVLLGIECTPEAYSGLDSTTVNKGEALMIKTS
jgi:hypothetical protein